MNITIEQIFPMKHPPVDIDGLLAAQTWIEDRAAAADSSIFKIAVFANDTLAPTVLFHPKRSGKERPSHLADAAVLDFRSAVRVRLEHLAAGNFAPGCDIPQRQHWAERAAAVLKVWPK